MNLLVHLTGSAVEEENPKQKGWIRAPTCSMFNKHCITRFAAHFQ